ncbi:MAG TPA: hypothetical protein VJR89_30860, partial [Polyangiales bacterium]|nr:hypothetical protein [Polyangiales bacterium]
MQRVLLAVALACLSAPAYADGKLVLGDRVLLREGPKDRAYCEAGGTGSPEECARVRTKVLSGYNYARGNVSGGFVFDTDGLGGVGGLHVSPASADLPGGKLALATFDAVAGDAAT